MLDLLTAMQPRQDLTLRWGEFPLRRRFYVTDHAPPVSLTTSARAVIFRGSKVVVVRDAGGFHVTPGGRREDGETLDDTLRRELREETGWNVTGVRPLGVIHYQHLSPVPKEWPYPHPDFLQAVSIAEGASYARGVIVRDDNVELGSKLVSIRQAIEAVVDDRVVLQAALELRARSAKT